MRRPALLLMGSGMTCLLALALPAASGAVTTAPQISGSLLGVSCTSATSCVAVGVNYAKTQKTEQPISESWNGSTWTFHSPSTQQNSVLNAVSCWSNGNCVAVGDVGKSGLAETWNGSTWKTMPTPPTPKGQQMIQLAAVTCLTSSYCIAAGYYWHTNFHGALAEKWNGKSWTVLPVPTPIGGTQSHFYGLSCVTTSGCMAVGSFELGTGSWPVYAAWWNGKSWTNVLPPGGASQTPLEGVSCASATMCMAINQYLGTGSGGMLWNGHTWSLQPSKVPHPPAPEGAMAMSCRSATFCMEIGGPPLADLWNGSTWTSPWYFPTPGGGLTDPVGLSCTSTTSCMAVGADESSNQTSTTLAEYFNGKTWTVESS